MKAKLIITHVDVSPKKGVKKCQNCKHFLKWGVHMGSCTLKDKYMMDRNSCQKFENENSKQ